MRTEAEVRKAAEKFAWYVASLRIARQGYETQQNLIGVIACLEWVLDDDARNPVSQTLRDIALMQQQPADN